MKVTLDHESHIYSSNTGITFKSVSALIEQFVPFFDFEQKSYDYSIKHGIPVEEVRANWREKNKLSTVYGKKIHGTIEKLLTEKTFCHKEEIYNSVLKEVEKLIEKGSKFTSEKIIHNEEYKIAGTSDLIIERKDDFDIVDFKTNKKIKFDNNFDDGTLLFPLNHIPNAEFFKYSLQLSLYAYMHELSSKKRLYRLLIYWFKRKKPDDYNSYEGTWVRMALPYLKEEAKLMLEYGAKK